MAVNAYTLDHVERTLFYRKNTAGVPVPLPFALLKLDGTDYYEPQPSADIAPNGKRQAGAVVGAVFLARNMPVPRPASGQNPDKHAVFAYYGL